MLTGFMTKYSQAAHVPARQATAKGMKQAINQAALLPNEETGSAACRLQMKDVLLFLPASSEENRTTAKNFLLRTDPNMKIGAYRIAWLLSDAMLSQGGFTRVR